MKGCRFSTPAPRQPMAQLLVLVLMSSRFPLRKSEENVILVRLQLTNSDFVGLCCAH